MRTRKFTDERLNETEKQAKEEKTRKEEKNEEKFY